MREGVQEWVKKREKVLQEKMENGEKRVKTNEKERVRILRKNGEKRRRIQCKIEKSNARFVSETC